MKEGLFFSCLAMLLLFEGFYLMVNPVAMWSFGVSALLGFFSSAIIVGVLAGVTAVTVGIGETSVRILFISTAILNLLFSFTFDFWIGAYHAVIPVGMGILYPTAWNIFAGNTGDFLGYLGFIFITGMAVIMLTCGILMGAGSGE